MIYVAGFFDGEGSIGMYTNGGSVVYLKVQLVQNQSPESTALLSQLCAEFGGHVSSSVSASGKTKLNWQISSKKAADFLRTISPFLRGKREQAAIAVNWSDRRTKSDPELDQATAKLLKSLKGNS